MDPSQRHEGRPLSKLEELRAKSSRLDGWLAQPVRFPRCANGFELLKVTIGIQYAPLLSPRKMHYDRIFMPILTLKLNKHEFTSKPLLAIIEKCFC
jgi:hypothetical protein